MLRSDTDPRWIRTALSDLDEVLADHAHCEKKAAATALSLVAAYPDREQLVRRMSALAIEELRHFRQVHARLVERGIALGRDPGDAYARRLMAQLRSGPGARLTDRLLVAGLIEARSCERLALLAEHVSDAGLAELWGTLARAERGHARLFVELAERYDGEGAAARLDELAAREAEIVAELPIAPRIH